MEESWGLRLPVTLDLARAHCWFLGLKVSGARRGLGATSGRAGVLQVMAEGHQHGQEGCAAWVADVGMGDCQGWGKSKWGLPGLGEEQGGGQGICV